jgi:beta-phosphoglucomutase-like phosphatase (HAD superfamily)
MNFFFVIMFSILSYTACIAEDDLFRSYNGIKAIIFDCDGTLVDSEHSHYLAWQYAFQQQGFELDRELYSTFVGKGHLTVLKMAIAFIGFDCTEELSNDKNMYFHKLQMEGIPPIKSTVDFLHLLFQEKKKYGLKLAVASGAKKEEILRNLRNLGIEDYFDVVLSGYDDLGEYQDPEGTNKPKPYVYLKTAKILNLAPEECVAIEDSRTGVSSAVTAGCITIAIPNSYTQQQDLSHADMQIESLASFSVEDFFNLIAFLKIKEACF